MTEKELKFESTTLEKYILAYLIKDTSFFLKLSKFLKTDNFDKKSYFNDNKLQFILNTAVVYHKNYDKLPSYETYVSIIEKKFKEDNLVLLKTALLNSIKSIFEINMADIDLEYLQEETLTFIRTKRAVEATYKNAADIENGDFSKLSDRMLEAVNINLDEDLGLSISDSTKTFELLREAEVENGLSFGSNNVDKILGEPKQGELIVWCGTPGIGKTIWLGNVCTTNIRNGKKGVFFSMEVDKKRLANRLYRSILMKRSTAELLETPKKEIEEVLNSFEDGGDIVIKNFPANTASCNDFDAYLTDLKSATGFVPDYIVIDYILITSTNSKKSDSEQSYKYYKTVSEEMRNLGVKWKCPVFTAAQLNREAQAENGGTKKVVGSRSLSESRGILDTADYCLIINQTDEEKKLAEKDGIAEQRLLIAKNRNGDSGSILNFSLDYKTMTIMDGRKRN